MWSLEQSYSEEETVGLQLGNNVNQELYEISTLGKLCQMNNDLCSPNVIAKFAGEKLVLVVDKWVFVIDERYTEFTLSIEFESLVDCIEITDDAQLLLVGERNGSFSIYHIDSEKRLITKNVVKSPDEEKPSFYSICIMLLENGMSQVSLLTTGSVLYSFKNLNLSALANALYIRDWIETKNILDRLETSVMDLSIVNSSLPKGLFYSPRNLVLCFYGSGQYSLGIDIKDSIGQLISLSMDNSTTIKKAIYSNDDRFIFTIDAKGSFWVFDGSTFIPVKTWNNEEIIDFTLLESTNEKLTVCDRKLVFLINSKESETYKLVYKDWPSLKQCYEVQVSDYSYLADPILNGDNICVVEGIRSNFKTNVDVLKIRVISEVIPQMRFEKLIQKGRFEQAELFAKQFNLNSKEIHKPHVRSLASGDLNTITMQKIREILLKIKDPKFIADFSSTIRAPSMDMMKEIFGFCIESLENFKPEESSEFLREVYMAEEKLRSFIMLYPKTEDWMNWFKFSKTHWSDIFLIFLRGLETDKAFYIWRQHYKEILSIFNEDDIEGILKAIPDNTPTSELCVFLRDSFLQPVLVTYPNLVEQLSRWIIQKSDMYEVLQKTDWPSNSIKLLSVLPETCFKITEKSKHTPINASLVNLKLHKPY